MAALRQAEQDAQRKAAIEAENKQQADAALARAQAEREKADEEAAARRRTDAEAAAEQQADAEAKQKVDADAASAVAEKQKAETLAKQKADAEAAAVAEKQAAEAAENALRLPAAARQRLQVAAKADAEAKARAGVVPQGTAETPSNRPAGRWNGNIHCKTWPPGGMRLNLSSTGGEASGAARGGTSHFAIVIADNKYSGTLRFTLPNSPTTLSASFSGTIVNDAIASTIIVRADFRNPSGANDDQCTLVLARTG